MSTLTRPGGPHGAADRRADEEPPIIRPSLARVAALHNPLVASRRGVAALGAGVTVALTALSGALINELHQGWPWWVAAGAVVLSSAAVSVWLTLRAPDDGGGDRLGAGAVKAGRDIGGSVATHVYGQAASSNEAPSAHRDQLGPGAVKADRDVRGDVRTNTNPPPPHSS